MTYQQACNEILRMEEEIRLLEIRQGNAERDLRQKKEQVEEYINQFYKEKGDVDRLEKLSVTKLLAKISGSYDEKHKKEYQEYVSAKNKMDEGNWQIEEQQKLIQRYKDDIGRLKEERKALHQQIRQDYPEGQAIAAEEEVKRRELLRKKKELEEASVAASQVFAYACQARDSFSSADSWATWDIVGGGLLSDMAKYSALDEGTALVHQMQAAAKQMTKELQDVDMTFDGTFDAVNDSMRTWDYFLDNIFTDWSVKERIESNLQQIKSYCSGLQRLQDRLSDQIKQIDQELRVLDGE